MKRLLTFLMATSLLTACNPARRLPGYAGADSDAGVESNQSGGTTVSTTSSGDTGTLPSPTPSPTLAGPLALGTVNNVQPISGCPQGFLTNSSCDTATVSCAGAADISVTFGAKTPSGTVNGTVFLEAGAGGLQPFNIGITGSDYADSLVAAGYRVVQVAWATPWEDTDLATKSVKIAACRPATLLNYVYSNIHGGSTATGGMCALGEEDGSDALAYALSWYGASSYLDKVSLLSGPLYSDISQGCQVPAASVSVCPSGQWGCAAPSWSANLAYGNAAPLIQSITGDPTCANTAQTATSSTSASAWLAMSIIDGTGQASFQFPNTALSGWVCNNALDSSAAEGQLYFQNFTSASQTAAYSVNAIYNCLAADDIWDGTTFQGGSGYAASLADLTDPVLGCVKRH